MKKKEEERKREDRGRERGTGKRIARSAGKKIKEEDFGTTVISEVHGTPAIVSGILGVFFFSSSFVCFPLLLFAF